jgi:hypothetical protein
VREITRRESLVPSQAERKFIVLQTRSGRCPNCKEELLTDVENCPNCGFKLNWSGGAPTARRTAVPQAGSTPRAASAGKLTSHTAIEWLAYLVGAGLLIFLALWLRNNFFSGEQNLELDATHAIRVADAERFHQQIFALANDPQAPEAAYVLGTAMPNNSDVLEITLKADWKSLDYATRLRYANNFARRWIDIHAPHRSYFSLLDENGEEIGGRTLTGTVWVPEKHEFVRASKKSRAPANASGNGSTPSAAPEE